MKRLLVSQVCRRACIGEGGTIRHQHGLTSLRGESKGVAGPPASSVAGCSFTPHEISRLVLDLSPVREESRWLIYVHDLENGCPHISLRCAKRRYTACQSAPLVVFPD